MTDYDAVVVGLGATGGAALHRLALRGRRVAGIEQFAVGHDRGSSHGETRIFRLGYFEHPSYVPLLREALALWRDLERASGRALLTATGIAEIGAPDGALVAGTLASARLHGLPHDVLDADAAMKRYPAFRLPQGFVAVVQPDAGFLAAEAAVAAQVALARAAGAEVHENERVLALEPDGDGVRVVTGQGAYAARTAVVAAGPWLGRLLPQVAAPVRATRQVAGWFAPRDPAPFAVGAFPVFLAETRHGVHYGFPVHGPSGLKIAKHHHDDEAVDPDTYSRAVTPRDERLIRDFVADLLPAADGPPTRAETCLYTMAPDGDFIIDRLPGWPAVIVASPCSGHGFKFAPVVGDILAELATDGGTRRDISRFRLARFG